MWVEEAVAYFKVLFWHLPGGLRKTTKDLSQDSRSPDRDLNPGHSEHEAGVLTTQPRLSINRITQVYAMSSVTRGQRLSAFREISK
jgi:hypothetical protein